MDNLAVHFEEDELKKFAEECYELYEQDNDSRSPWLSKAEEYLEIFHQIDTYDNNYVDDFNGSNARVPLLTESCLSFQSRGYKALFPQRSFVATTSMVDITPEETARSERIAKWMNYRLNFKERRYKKDKKRMLLAVPLMGSDFTKTYPSPVDGMPKVERVRAQDFIVSYGTGPRELDDVRRKTQVITMDMNKARKLHKDGFFIQLPAESDIDTSENIQEVENEAAGMTPPASNVSGIARIIEQHTFYDLDGDGIEEPVIIWIDSDRKPLRVAARYDINDTQKTPIEYFTHYPFIENPDGFYGLGYGHLIGKLNVTLNQMVINSSDAAELANSGNMGGFMSEAVGVKGGENEITIGKFIKVPRNVEDLNKAIYQMKFPGPNAAYVGLVEFLQGVIQRLANTTEAVSGDVSKVYQPMTILTMLEQSLQLPTSIMETIALAMEEELTKILDIAAKNANMIDTFTFEKEKVSVTKEDFAVATRVYPIMDPRSITKQQKMAKAQSVYQIGMGNPLIANNPNSIYAMTKEVLESMEVQNIDEILPKPQNQEPQRIDDQYAENMYFLLPMQDRPLFDVFPEQDHKTHIMIIDRLLQEASQHAEVTGKMEIPEDSLQAIMVHRQKHVAYLYGQMHGVINGQGQLGAMEAQAGDEALLAALANELSMGGIPNDMSGGEGGAIPGAGGGFEGSGEIPGVGVLERVPLDQRNTQTPV